MARHHPDLQIRGSIWWSRIRVPDRVRAAIGRNEIRRSLQTSDASVAKQKANIERLKIDAEFN
jgi:hypothetical protein